MLETGRVTLVAAPGSIIGALQDLAVTVVNPADLSFESFSAAQLLANTSCDVVVLSQELPLDRALAVADDLTKSFPEIEVVLLARPTETVLIQAMKVGIRQVVDPKGEDQILREAVSRINDAAALRRTRLGAAAADEPVKHRGRVITVMAAKGGVGKSTIAVNLATYMAQSAPNEVVVVDLNLAAGEVDLLLGIEPKATIASVAGLGAVVDTTGVKLSLTPHSSGLLVLAAPESLIEADAVDSSLILETLMVLRASFQHIIVDTAPGAGAELAAAVEATDDLLAIATPDLGGLRSLRRNLDGLDTLGLTTARRHLVLNRADHRTGLASQAIESAAEMPIAQSIPDAREIPTAANQGLPFMRTQPKSEAARAIRSLAARLEPSTKAANGQGNQRLRTP